jgi:tRNA threonylcarbamoyladenosine modification (KEOPS) complex  Pcc1 subunit
MKNERIGRRRDEYKIKFHRAADQSEMRPDVNLWELRWIAMD